MVCVMEVKPTKGRPDLPLPRFLPDSRSVRSWRWRVQIQEISKGQSSTKYVLVHAVKEGETLTSIAKHYGVSAYSIAAVNRDKVDLRLVLQGQLLNIPCSTSEAQVFGTVKRWLHDIKVPQRLEGSLNNTDGLENQNIFTMLAAPCGFPHAKTAGCLLVLVPVVILCIRCIMGALHNKRVGDSKQKIVNKSKGSPEAKSSRWRSALSDLDILDSQPSSTLHNYWDDQSETPYDDMSGDFSKLEGDYEKFLTECGVSERGYWRGGSSE